MKDSSELFPHVYITRSYPAAVEAAIRSQALVCRVNFEDRYLSADELASCARGATHLFLTTMDHVDRNVIQALSGTLQAIATLSVGFDHIDIEAARLAGIAVFNTPDVLSEACAEVALMHILNAARRGHEGNQLVRGGKWSGWAPTQLLGLGLSGKRLGILGLGRIGRAVAARAQAFGMEIHYHNRHRLSAHDEDGAIYHSTAESLLRVSEFFTITAPGSPALANFLNSERIALLPRGAVVVNISRGEMVNDDALIQAMKTGQVFAAGLDVFKGEPMIDRRYCEQDNAFLTPHIGSATIEVRNAMGFKLIDGINMERKGHAATNRLV